MPSTSPESAYFQRYREPVAPTATAWNDTLDVLLNHRSVRAFAPTPVPDGTLETLVAAASSAPTSSNKQFWSVVSVEAAGTRAELAKLAGNQAFVAESPMLLMWLADLSRIAAVGEAQGVTLEGLDYTESFLVGAMDAAFAAQNAVVAAEAMGLSTVYVGAMRNHPVEVARLLGLPPRCFAVFGMCIGYADADTPTAVKPRLPQDAVLHRERYDAATAQAALERYESHAQAFRREQGQSDQRWSHHIMSRVRDAQALKGRDLLRQALQTLGFEMK